MTRVILHEDCGNSPKNKLLKKFTIAFAKRDVKFILDSVTENVGWNILGDQMIEGKENLTEFLKRSKNMPVALLTIHHVTSHGKAGAVDGTQMSKEGKILAFCNVYEFRNTKGTVISQITSYVINIR
jgi:hypothetical protein